MKFEDLPIIFRAVEYGKDGWFKHIERDGTIAELLETWDIDDPEEMDEIAQVLRHLRNALK